MKNIRDFIKSKNKQNGEKILDNIALKTGNHLLLSCFPKSGSTFTVNTIANLTKYKITYIAYAYEFNEQNMYLPKILDVDHEDTITQLHVPATNSNIELINNFNYKNIVLVRNIYDVCMSYLDHYKRESIESPAAYLTDEYHELDEEKKIDFIVDHVVPWYLKFYVSWYEAYRKSKNDFMFITYEEMVDDKTKYFKKILKYWNLIYSDEDINTAINKSKQQKSRINKGVTGRGSCLSEAQKLRINILCSYYPWVDFSRIGVNKK